MKRNSRTRNGEADEKRSLEYGHDHSPRSRSRNKDEFRDNSRDRSRDRCGNPEDERNRKEQVEL